MPHIKSFRSFGGVLCGLILAFPLQAQRESDVDGHRRSEPKYACSTTPVSGATPVINNIRVNGGLVFLNDRIEPDNEAFWSLPHGKVFVLTDIVVQNRAPGDEPVATTAFTRFSITSSVNTLELPGKNVVTGDIFFTVVGNKTFNAHFESGIPISSRVFRFLNVINSTAPFVEFSITGILHDCE
jgi:hypothetical protein